MPALWGGEGAAPILGAAGGLPAEATPNFRRPSAEPFVGSFAALGICGRASVLPRKFGA